MEIVPLGDSALIVRWADDLDPVLLRHTEGLLERASLPGLIECAPAYNSLGLFFEPVEEFEPLKARVEEVLKQSGVTNEAPRRPVTVEIPVCYEDEFAPDLEEVARHTGLSEEEIVHRHSGAQYRVRCIGFVPGFPYLGGLPPELATPRRATPRTQVPAGAVAIGGAQTGIYPIDSPGGWNLIGRTSLRLFDLERDPPALLQTGDRVRFQAVTRAQYDSR